MNSILTILVKEVRDNLRDKRALFFALVYGPLLMPALMLGPLIVNVGKNSHDYNTARVFHVSGGEHAPNLLSYLRSKNLDAHEVEEGFQQQIQEGELKLVLEIAATYGERLLAGEPAQLTLHYKKESSESQNLYWQVRGELENFSAQMSASRLAIRGFDPNLLRPLEIVEEDLSEEAFGSSVLANIVMFLVVFSSTMGGFYLAADINAGERERHSLEPLLSLSLTRTQVALGKYLAVFCFCAVSFILPIISVGIWASFLPESFFGQAPVPTVRTYLTLILLAFPMCVLLSSFLMAFATFSKSMKEAQTQMGFAMLILMAPFFVVQFMDVRLNTINQWVPILSQYLLANEVLGNANFSVVAMLPGACACFALSLLLLSTVVYMYRQDQILGN